MGLRVMALSLRHHGRSTRTGSARLAQHVSDVLAVIHELGAPQILIGHSMGALVVQHVARHVPVPQVALLAPVPPNGLSDVELTQALGALKTAAARSALAEALTDYKPLPMGCQSRNVRVIGGLQDKVVSPEAVRRTAAFHGTRAVMLEAGHALLTGPMWAAAARAATEPVLSR
jgi:predicted alpha/beta hydrolase family esterase